MAMNPSALIADDEPLLRENLRRQLAQCWPELAIVAEARTGPEALALFERHQPAICFLDIHMPGLSGIEVASQIGRRAHLVFVTAYDQYAVQAFEHSALDYLIKPVRLPRQAWQARLCCCNWRTTCKRLACPKRRRCAGCALRWEQPYA